MPVSVHYYNYIENTCTILELLGMGSREESSYIASLAYDKFDNQISVIPSAFYRAQHSLHSAPKHVWFHFFLNKTLGRCFITFFSQLRSISFSNDN